MTSALFSPIELRGLTLPNRVIVAPMCQYSACMGRATDWHVIHLGYLAQSGSGMLIVEASGVEPRGRITHRCLGLYDDASETALNRVIRIVRQWSNTPIAIQLGHAGRKASAHPPQDGGKPLDVDEGAWETIAPSAIPFANDWHRPVEMDRALMDEVVGAHVDAVQRAERIGFEAIEMHGAHGYLMSEFLSPIANQRKDEFGGCIANRIRYPIEVFEAMREAWPQEKPMGVRFNGTDWDDRGMTLEDAIFFGKALKAVGCDFFDISGGGNSLRRPSVGPGYQAPYAAAIKEATGVPTMAVGMIRDPSLAEELISSNKCDMVALARGFLYEPRWTWRAAHELGEAVTYPEQYIRSNPLLWPQAFPGMDEDEVHRHGWVAGAAPHIMVPDKPK
ncbi:MAG: oxidoreductase [Rhodospirillaceae bacterium]|nr:oxidoreductase [Rhodospirillaceae bacterium]